jgi:hypothetical protein
MTDTRPSPVLDQAKVAALATFLTAALVTLLARRGVLLPADLSDPIADLIGVGLTALVGVLSTLWAAIRAKGKVTPVEDPRDDDGTPLVRQDRTDLPPIQDDGEPATSGTPPSDTSLSVPELLQREGLPPLD